MTAASKRSGQKAGMPLQRRLRAGGDPCNVLFQQQKWIPAPERVKKIGALATNSVVMGRLDRAIQKKHKQLNRLLDGRIKPGHDGGGVLRGGNDAAASNFRPFRSSPQFLRGTGFMRR